MEHDEAFLQAQTQSLRHGVHVVIAQGTFAAVMQVASAFVLAHIVASAVFAHASLPALWPWLAILPLFYGVRAALAWAAERQAFRLGVQIRQRIRRELLEKLKDLGPVWLSGAPAGAVITAVVDGVEALDAYFTRYLPQRALAVWVPFVLLAAVLPADWVSALVLVVTAPLIPVFMILVGKGAEELNRRQWHRLAVLGGHFLDMLEGLTTLRLFDRSRAEAAIIGKLSDDYRHGTMQVLRVAFLSSLVLEFFATVSIATVAVLIGFRLMWHDLGFEQGLFVLLLAPEFYLPLRRLGTHYHARMDALGATRAILQVWEAQPPPALAGTRVFTVSRALALQCVAVGQTYGEGRRGLDNVSFSIDAGEHVALVGPSGAGKTTLFRLLLGFLAPTQGEILVNGASLAGFSPASWRQALAWLPQTPHLIHGSVLDNLRLARRDARRPDIEAAARDAHAHEFIVALPNGYDTVIGDGGHALSGGERQRLALARAFLRNAPLVLLDEPAAHLDAENEYLINEALVRLGAGRTLLVIAHRPSTMRRMDRILVLERGQLVQSGRHAELISQGGLYAELVA